MQLSESMNEQVMEDRACDFVRVILGLDSPLHAARAELPRGDKPGGARAWCGHMFRLSATIGAYTANIGGC
jgi:hypothetical protein